MRKNMHISPDEDYEQEEERKDDIPVTNFGAIRRLKHTENDVEAIRNRIHMLRLTEERHIKKLEEEQRKIDRVIQAKEQASKTKLERQRYAQHSCEHLQALKQQNIESKREALNRLAHLRSEIRQMKASECQQMKQKSQHIDERIKVLKKRYQQQNLLKRNSVLDYEQKQRIVTQQFKQERLSEIHSCIDNDTRTFLRKQGQKEAELKRLQQLQMQLVERCSRSSQAVQQVRDKRQNLMQKSLANKQNSLPQLTRQPQQ